MFSQINISKNRSIKNSIAVNLWQNNMPSLNITLSILLITILKKVNIKTKQFIHNVNSDESKETEKIIKS